jgi:hypothetical protein
MPLYFGKLQTGQLIYLAVGHVLEPRLPNWALRAAVRLPPYFSIKSTIEVAVAWIEFTCDAESTSLSA